MDGKHVHHEVIGVDNAPLLEPDKGVLRVVVIERDDGVVNLGLKEAQLLLRVVDAKNGVLRSRPQGGQSPIRRAIACKVPATCMRRSPDMWFVLTQKESSQASTAKSWTSELPH